jgi:hypothetical protein
MYEWLGQYMDHTEERHTRHPALGRSTKRMAVLVAACVPAVTVAEAVRLIGILFTNCFELSLGEMRARALYPLVSLVNHSCLPNLLHTNLIQEVRSVGGLEGDMVVMQLEASRTILPGNQLTIRYNHYTQVRDMEVMRRKKFPSMGVHFPKNLYVPESSVAEFYHLMRFRPKK